MSKGVGGVPKVGVKYAHSSNTENSSAQHTVYINNHEINEMSN